MQEIPWPLSLRITPEMASLQCLHAIKNRQGREMSTRSVEAAAVADFRLPRRTGDRQDKLYDIEVVEEAGPRVKIHYIGYGREHDEWRPRGEIVVNKPAFSSKEEEPYSPLTELACSIKKSLKPSRSEEPEVRIQLPCDLATFTLLKEKGTLPGRRRGVSATDDGSSREQYTITHYSDLDELLGEKWHFRVVNPIGDFSYVILETISFHLTMRRPILDYEVTCKVDGTLTFDPIYIEQPHAIVFTFVRGDGNKNKLVDFI